MKPARNFLMTAFLSLLLVTGMGSNGLQALYAGDFWGGEAEEDPYALEYGALPEEGFDVPDAADEENFQRPFNGKTFEVAERATVKGTPPAGQPLVSQATYRRHKH